MLRVLLNILFGRGRSEIIIYLAADGHRVLDTKSWMAEEGVRGGGMRGGGRWLQHVSNCLRSASPSSGDGLSSLAASALVGAGIEPRR